MTGGRYYVYGRGCRELWTLLRDPAFSALVDDLLRHGDADPAAVPPATLEAAVRRELVAVAGGPAVAGSALVAVPAASSAAAVEAMAPAFEHYVAGVADTLPALHRAYGRCAAAERFTWSEVEHALVAGWFLDLAVGSALWSAGLVERAAWETAVWAFEAGVGDDSFGVQWVGWPLGRCGLGQLWHCRTPRRDLRVGPEEVRRLHDLAFASGPIDVEARHDLLLGFHGLLADRGTAPRASMPAFAAADVAHLLAVVEPAAARLVERAVRPAVTAASRLPWWRARRHPASVRHALVRVVLEAGVDRVRSAGLLAAFPGLPPAASWGRWVWVDPPASQGLVPGAFTEAARAVAG